MYSADSSNDGYPIYQEFEDLLNYEGIDIYSELWTSSNDYGDRYYYYEPDTGSDTSSGMNYDYFYAICVYDGITSIPF